MTKRRMGLVPRESPNPSMGRNMVSYVATCDYPFSVFVTKSQKPMAVNKTK